MTAWGTAPAVAVCPGEFLERVVFLESDPYDRLTSMAQQARANEAQFLEHLILRAEAIYNFQPSVVAEFVVGPRPQSVHAGVVVWTQIGETFRVAEYSFPTRCRFVSIPAISSSHLRASVRSIHPNVLAL